VQSQREKACETAKVVTLTLDCVLVVCAYLLLLLLRVHSGTIEGSEFLMAFFKLGREVSAYITTTTFPSTYSSEGCSSFVSLNRVFCNSVVSV
jgi:hypothetical protein